MTNSQTLAAAEDLVGANPGNFDSCCLDWLAERIGFSLDKLHKQWTVMKYDWDNSGGGWGTLISEHKRRELALARAVLAVAKQDQSK